jgi:hypothetical protein
MRGFLGGSVCGGVGGRGWVVAGDGWWPGMGGGRGWVVAGGGSRIGLGGYGRPERRFGRGGRRSGTTTRPAGRSPGTPDGHQAREQWHRNGRIHERVSLRTRPTRDGAHRRPRAIEATSRAASPAHTSCEHVQGQVTGPRREPVGTAFGTGHRHRPPRACGGGVGAPEAKAIDTRRPPPPPVRVHASPESCTRPGTPWPRAPPIGMPVSP